MVTRAITLARSAYGQYFLFHRVDMRAKLNGYRRITIIPRGRFAKFCNEVEVVDDIVRVRLSHERCGIHVKMNTSTACLLWRTQGNRHRTLFSSPLLISHRPKPAFCMLSGTNRTPERELADSENIQQVVKQSERFDPKQSEEKGLKNNKTIKKQYT